MEMFANILKIYLSLRYTSPSFIHFDPIGKHRFIQASADKAFR